MTAAHERGRHFQALHASGSTFVMANAWDAGSAAVLAAAGVRAVGTTSAGVAFSRALPDYEGALDFDAALEATRRIAEAVEVPVSMDSENGYAHDPDGVYANVSRIIDTGVVGASIEDYTGDARSPHYDIEHAAERVRAAKAAVRASGTPFVLTARSECVLTEQPDGLAAAIDRVQRYAEAGADCVFVPGLGDIDAVRALVRNVDVPVNVLIGLNNEALSVASLQALGVARISIGGALARAALGLVRRAAREMLDEGTFGFSAGQIPDAELCALFGGRAV
ncbi:MAG: isocitrate lyase/phosphoenolpyruvate mutase family protein [Pseudomonadota bacterium]